MKRIPSILFLDYLLFSIGIFLLIIFIEPFGSRYFLENNSSPYFYYAIEAAGFLGIFIFCEILTSYVFDRPSDYYQNMNYQMKRMVFLFVPNIILSTLFDGHLFCVIKWGWKRWYYHWFDTDGTFTLKWFAHDMSEVISVGALIIIYYIFVTYNRMQRIQIDELTELNDKLLNKQEKSGHQEGNVENDNIITLQGEGKDSLTLNPSDIVYIESVANYVSVSYYNESEICHKRLRGSLKDCEDALKQSSMIMRVHRAFLVNMNFITQVSGNAAGYKLEMMGTEKTIPVSKANVKAFKERIEEGK